MDTGIYILFLLIGLVLWIAALFAQFRLFSIDNSLKKIVQRLERQGAPPELASTVEPQDPGSGAVPMVAREVSECTRCHYKTVNLDPGRCGNCGNTEWERQTIKVAITRS
jgi:predicted Zn-ribbon and HTH transcriptional regulator